MKHFLTLSAIGLTVLLSACSKTSLEPHSHPLHQMDFSSSPELVDVHVQHFDSKSTSTLTGYLKNGKIMLQGDMVLAEAPRGPLKQATLETQMTRWTNNTVPYVIDASLSAQTNLIQQAVNWYNANTNVKWVPRTNQANYVRMFKGDGCWSYVGMLGGKQDLSLGEGCHDQGTVLHEMTHAVGLQHEQARPDRDQWITVNWNNIPADWRTQFEVIPSSRAYGSYDFYSIMHYGLYWGDKLAMTPKVSGIDYNRVGNGTTLTATDRAAVNSLYPVSTAPCSGSNCTRYTGNLSTQGSSTYLPDGTYFLYAGGTLKGWLQGPSGTDFDLYLERWSGSAWQQVAKSDGTTSVETITYAAGNFYYRWKVVSYSGTGSFSFWMQK